MSNEGTPATRTLSPWWSLLILPVALVAGWFIGQMSSPKTAQSRAANSQSASPTNVSASAALPRTGGIAPAGGNAELLRRDLAAAADPRPTVIDPPAAQSRRTEISQWTTLDDAMEESRRDGKPVMIDFNADWCGPCQMLKRQVFEDGARGEAVQTAVIPVSIVDRARENGSNPPEIESLQQRFQVDAFPTLIVFSPATGRTMKTRGFGGADATLEWITEAARAVR